MENFSLVNSHNLLENPLLFSTEITNLLFISAYAGQNGMLSATEQNQTYNHSFFFRRLTTI